MVIPPLTSNEKKYTLPPFLVKKGVDEQQYRRWLQRKANAHQRRDAKRGLQQVTVAKYREAIHQAVLNSQGRDAYTGEELDWSLISQYNNNDSKVGKHRYKAEFGLLPTVDHIEASANSASFVICAWRTNDAKSDLNTTDFLALCEQVLRHAGYQIRPPMITDKNDAELEG